MQRCNTKNRLLSVWFWWICSITYMNIRNKPSCSFEMRGLCLESITANAIEENWKIYCDDGIDLLTAFGCLLFVHAPLLQRCKKALLDLHDRNVIQASKRSTGNGLEPWAPPGPMSRPCCLSSWSGSMIGWYHDEQYSIACEKPISHFGGAESMREWSDCFSVICRTASIIKLIIV